LTNFLSLRQFHDVGLTPPTNVTSPHWIRRSIFSGNFNLSLYTVLTHPSCLLISLIASNSTPLTQYTLYSVTSLVLCINIQYIILCMQNISHSDCSAGYWHLLHFLIGYPVPLAVSFFPK
jgi:hypothetical protein